MPQGELFGRPRKRARRAWTELDLLRAHVEHLRRRIGESGGTERDLAALADAEAKLIQREEEARVKWKNSFGS